MASMVFTFWGFPNALGLIASTTLFSNVQEDESLRDCISEVIGSADLKPHTVPEQGLSITGLIVLGPTNISYYVHNKSTRLLSLNV